MSVRRRGNKLVIDFTTELPGGERVRCVETEGDDTPANRKRVESKWKSVQYALKYGGFNYLSFFPRGTKVRQFEHYSDKNLQEYYTLWIKEKAVSNSYHTALRGVYENYILPRFGWMKLADISESDILIFRKELLSKGLSNNTVNAYIGVFKQILLTAASRGDIKINPCAKITPLRGTKPEIEPFTLQEIKHLLSVLKKADPVWHDIIIFWVHTGLRPGELMALEWKHLDIFYGKIMIRQTLLNSGEMGPPKTEKSVRDVDVPEDAMAALKRQRERTGLADGLIFLSHTGNGFNHFTIRQKLEHCLKLAGIKFRPPNQLRHTFATWAIANGEQPSWVAAMMGHSNPEMTWKKYNKFVPNLTRQDGSAFEKFFREEESNPEPQRLRIVK